MGSQDVSLSVKIEQLRQSIKDLRIDDEKLESQLYLYHWMRANKMDVKKTEKAIRESAKWRKENGIDDLVEKDLDPQIAARFPYLFGMTGKGGIPVSYFQVGGMQAVSLIQDFGKDRLVLHLAQCLAKKEKIVYDFDKSWTWRVEDMPPERAVGLYGIYDAEGYSIKNNSSIRAFQFFAEWAKMLVNHFPAAGHIIRATNGAIFGLPYLNLKTALTDVQLNPIIGTRLDFTVHGRNEDDWEVVSGAVTREQLEEFKTRARALKNQRN